MLPTPTQTRAGKGGMRDSALGHCSGRAGPLLGGVLAAGGLLPSLCPIQPSRTLSPSCPWSLHRVKVPALVLDDRTRLFPGEPRLPG